MENNYTKIYASGCNAPLKIRKGHFATNHAHINCYLDMTTLKTRVSEAGDIAKSLSSMFLFDTPVDTIVCMDGTEVIGAFLAEELAQGGILSTNAHKTIYVVAPEYNSNSQIVFRENILPMVKDKNVVLLAGAVTTGLSVNKGIEAIQYYGGKLRGITAVFSAMQELNGFNVMSIFGKNDIPDYAYADYKHCPLCQKGNKLEALVNAYGFSGLF